MKIFTSYHGSGKIKLTEIAECTPNESSFFVDECKGRARYAVVDGYYQRIIEIWDTANT